MFESNYSYNISVAILQLRDVPKTVIRDNQNGRVKAVVRGTQHPPGPSRSDGTAVWFELVFERNNAFYRRTTISQFPIYFAFLLNLHFAGHLIHLRVVICKLIIND